MIYTGSNTTVEINIEADLNAWAYEMLTKAGFENTLPERALYQYCNLKLRLLAPKPRKVKISKEFIVSEDCQNGYEYFKAAVERGDNLIPFMSKKIVDVESKDKMIYDWGMFHFHLGTEKDTNDPRFIKRADHLLIAFVDENHDDNMYFLQVRPHISDIWTEQDLVRILADNWPDIMEPYRIQGFISLTENISDADYKEMRKNNVNTFVDLHDGRVYVGANHGLNTAGTSVKAVSQYDYYCNNANLFEKWMGESTDSIGKAINQKLLTPEKEFQLKMIAPGDRDYLFEVVDHGFLLRFVLKDKKGIIVVGDNREQIDEKLKDL